jgi:hypothetical protein
VLWETPIEGLRLGGSAQSLRIDTTLVTMASHASAEIPATLTVGSLEYAGHDLLLSAEYSRWYVKVDSSNSTVLPQSPVVSSERAYAMAAYRASPWLQAGVYYSVLFPDTNHRSGRENMQHDVATTLRFDVNSHWLVKLEGHYMMGTAGITPASLNNNAPLSALERTWGVLLVKTTASF